MRMVSGDGDDEEDEETEEDEDDECDGDDGDMTMMAMMSDQVSPWPAPLLPVKGSPMCSPTFMWRMTWE